MEGRDPTFEKAMDEAEEVDSLRDVLNEFCKSIDFEYFGFGMQIWLPEKSTRNLFWTNYPKRWQETYDAREFVKIDPVVSYSLGNTVPAFWSDIEAMTGSRKVLQMARQYGLSVGITVPLNLPRDNFGVLSFARDRELAMSADAILQLKQRVLWFGHAFASRAISFTGPDEALGQKLSPRERQTLNGVSKGMKIVDIANEMGVSVSTVRYFITQAGRKLGVTGKNAVVAKAIAIGLLDVREVELRTARKFKLGNDGS